MGTFSDSLKRWFYQNNSSAATSTARIPLLDASGNPIGSDTLENIAKKQYLITGNVGIVTVNAGGYYELTRLDAYVSGGVCPWVYEGGHLFFTATGLSSQMTFCNTDEDITTITRKDTMQGAFNDFSGENNTNAIISELSTNALLANYCRNYSLTDITEEWWMPSMGEVGLIYAHKKEIELAISLINGSSWSFGDAVLASSTTCSPINSGSYDAIWTIIMNSGWASSTTMIANDLQVLPVTSPKSVNA